MRTIALSGAALLLLGLAACSEPVEVSEAAPATSTPTATPSPTPTIPVGPVELSQEEAGDRYLGIFCQRNAAMAALADSFDVGEEEYFAGGSPDVSAVNAAAAESLRLSRLTVELIDDSYYEWPEGVSDNLEAIRSDLLAESSALDSMVNADKYADAYQVPWPEGDASAAQEARYTLGLPADTTASCEGFAATAEEPHAAMVEREEYLASFED